MRSTMMRYPLTIAPILERANRYFPEVEIVSRLPDRSLHRTNYRALYHRARALAEALTREGLNPGDRVATLMWNHYAHLEAYFGVPMAGGVLHTLNLRLHPTDIAWIVNHAEDRYLIVDDVLLPLLAQFRDHIRPERIIVVPLTGRPLAPGLENYEEVLKSGTGRFVYPELDDEDALGMCYTSGTTGRPRGVVYSHRSTVLHCYNMALVLTSGDVVMIVVPMFHVNAWGMPYACAMIGSKQVLPGPHLDAESLLDLCEREQVTITGGVPIIAQAILDRLEREPGRFKLAPAMRFVVGGSAAPEAMFRAFDHHGITLVHGWGMTETSPLATAGLVKHSLDPLSKEDRYALRAKQGFPVPFVDVRVTDDDGTEVPADGKTVGELHVRGPYITGSYYKMAPDAEKFTADGWLRTGDMATVDAEGYIHITDRIKDLVKSGGEWISSVALECALIGHPAVAEAAVIGVPHPKWSERPLAVIVLRPNANVTGEELNKFIEGKFAKWWLPDDYVFVEAIPHSSTGKLQKNRLREQYAARFAAASRS